MPVRTPVPSVPSALTNVEVAASPRRGMPEVVLVAPAEPGDVQDVSSAPQSSAVARAVLLPARAATPVPAEWLPAVALSGRAGEVHRVDTPAGGPQWLLGIGAGERRDWRAAGAALVRALDAEIAAGHEAGARVPRAVGVRGAEDVPADRIAEFVLGVRLGGYRYVVTSAERPPVTRSVTVLVPEDGVEDAAATVDRAAELAAATGLARDLANTPSNVKNPSWLAGVAVRVAAGVPGLEAEVRDEAWLAEHGFGGMLAVGGGSVSPPRLIELTYRPRGAATHLLLVGKGITFDTGGISVKPADGMHLMRTDMSGGAAVIAAVRAIAALRLPVRVSALVPVAENHLSGSAYRPGDVLRHYGGRTTEVGNTDAEGRIVLADALAYGVEKFAPDAVVDVATLTGAMKVALGLRTGGLFATDDELAERVRAAGERVGEAWWRMPLLEAHTDAVRSDIADLKQNPSGPGGITAALFLREFAGGLPWAHLDIAGPARADKVYDEVTPGGTGFAARTLVELAAGYA